MITKRVVLGQIELSNETGELRLRFNMELVEDDTVLRSEYLRGAVPLDSDPALEVHNINNWLAAQQPAWPTIDEAVISEIAEHFNLFRARRQAVNNG